MEQGQTVGEIEREHRDVRSRVRRFKSRLDGPFEAVRVTCHEVKNLEVLQWAGSGDLSYSHYPACFQLTFGDEVKMALTGDWIVKTAAGEVMIVHAHAMHDLCLPVVTGEEASP